MLRGWCHTRLLRLLTAIDRLIVTADHHPVCARYVLLYAALKRVRAGRRAGKGAPAVHGQQFRGDINKHAITSFERWEANAKARSMNPAAFAMERWLMRRILDGELAPPELTALKKAVANASAEVDLAFDAPQDERNKLLRDLDLAIANLMAVVAEATRVAQR